MKTIVTARNVIAKRTFGAIFVSTIIAASFISPSAHAAGSSTNSRTISLTTTATLNVIPDTIAFSFTLNDTEKSNNAAYKVVSDLGNKVTALLKSEAVASVNITSSTVSLSPVYDYSNNTQTLTGYQANQNFNVVLRSIKNAPMIMSKVIDLGANSIQVNSTNAYVFNAAPNDEKLRARVIAKARTTAKSYAHLVGANLKNLVSLSENPVENNPIPVIFGKVAMASTDSTAPSINVGIQTLSLTVSTVWAIA